MILIGKCYITHFFCFLDGQRGEWGIVPSKYKVDEELLKRNIDSDSELGMGIAGSGVSVAGKTLIFWRVISFLLKQPFISLRVYFETSTHCLAGRPGWEARLEIYHTFF